jgi:hypothetical protein
MNGVCAIDKATRPMIKMLSSLGGLALALLFALALPASAAAQQTFATPEAAADALQAALKADNDAALLALFGEQYEDVIMTPDHAQNSVARERLATAMQNYRKLDETGPDRRVLVIGDQAWPMPIPLVRENGMWHFATAEGVDEIVNRRIGANERNAVYVLRAYLDAQKQYASEDRMGDGVLEYAQKLASSAGKHDGLYWPTDASKGEEESPFGPLVAESAPYRKGHQAGDPYRGYHFRILTRQGKNAPGGAYSYLINGRMIAGFAMVAYPDVHGQSGVMTFIVSQSGKIYQKDLGADTEKLAAAMSEFNPDSSWKLVQD